MKNNLSRQGREVNVFFGLVISHCVNIQIKKSLHGEWEAVMAILSLSFVFVGLRLISGKNEFIVRVA
ncbi:hypothetical protein [Kerstersia gyiorum]|uniref:hypothetical protein n=1 Tax=Kerstersia gyiorum TaxID=206506 RepID=UPI0030CF280F